MKDRMILVILNLVFLGASIWISLRAKPLGSMPYRWGAYLGMMAAWMSLVSMVSSVPAAVGGQVLGGLALGMVAVMGAVSSFGILRRRKFGVVAFGLAYGALILISPLVEPMQDQPFLLAIRDQPASLSELARQSALFPSIVSIVVAVVYFVVTIVYFKKRWALMGKATDALPAVPADGNHQK
jgi:hypothetical protein